LRNQLAAENYCDLVEVKAIASHAKSKLSFGNRNIAARYVNRVWVIAALWTCTGCLISAQRPE
jgi:hypothetical protein